MLIKNTDSSWHKRIVMLARTDFELCFNYVLIIETWWVITCKWKLVYFSCYKRLVTWNFFYYFTLWSCYTYTCTHTHMYTHTYTDLHQHMHTHTHVHTHTQTCINTCTHTHVHTHTHTQTCIISVKKMWKINKINAFSWNYSKMEKEQCCQSQTIPFPTLSYFVSSGHCSLRCSQKKHE